ncbi:MULTISPECIES: ABC transporter ATP-binding protein [Hyphobacterium]|uniref:ABC transporter ATP-binding protein n=1 Tax=Hyphobacterium vulgare TaxID=1736751 RepID=A0ABV6ZVH0_9PROT
MARIKLENVGVHYALPFADATSLRSALSKIALGGRIGDGLGGVGVTALEGVNLELFNGDRLGLIGPNGAGKTTLLQVMASILPPTSGRVVVEGRISSLLSIHTGLDQECSGLQNIRDRARHMGCTEGEIRRQFDDIAEFSELGDYLHLPMKTYSAGMRLRLAFAIATAFEPEVLILDEWISAGDAQFQKKAQARLSDLIERAGIFAFASHNRSLQSSFCTKGLVLEKGRPVFFGPINEALDYQNPT